MVNGIYGGKGWVMGVRGKGIGGSDWKCGKILGAGLQNRGACGGLYGQAWKNVHSEIARAGMHRAANHRVHSGDISTEDDVRKAL